MFNPIVTIITPTTGKDGLFKLIDSLEMQVVPYVHILLWDDKRDGRFLFPSEKTLKVATPESLNVLIERPSPRGPEVCGSQYSVVVPGSFVQGKACGSALRAIGLMLATTPYVTFADDDVWFEPEHLENMIDAVSVKNINWAYCRRKIWANEREYIGVDNFESVGNSPDRKVPYEMVDNNCMIFKRRLGTSGAVLYRETEEYNDDRLFYSFLKQHAGTPNIMSLATVNQICPERLIPMFKSGCTKDLA